MTMPSDDIVGCTVLGRYRIVKRLARGGMGVVYLARTEGAAGFAKPAVVKRILPDLLEDDKMTHMFVREARIMSYLQHPGIVGVLDFGEEDEAYIMVLEYVHGFHLGRWYRYAHATQGSFNPEIAIHLVIRVLEGLHYAHTLRRPDGKLLHIVHRDISPSNILISTNGHVKLADFGIARVSGETAIFRTEETTVKGKFPYLAPELFTGHQASVQSDLYSCGVVLHELLTGKNDFRGRDIAETVHRVFTHMPSLETVDQSNAIIQKIEPILHKALAKAAQDRFDSALDFAQALRSIRTLSDEKATALLAEHVGRDFNEDMAKRLGVEPLQVLDAAWRKEPFELDSSLLESHRPVPGELDSPDALAAAPPAEPSMAATVGESTARLQASSSRRWLWPVIAGALALAATIVVGAFVMSPGQSDAAKDPKVIYIEQDKAKTPPPSVAATETPSPSTDDAPTAEKQLQDDAPTPSKDSSTRKSKSTRNKPLSAKQRAASLRRTVARKMSSIKRCFQKHGGDQPTAVNISMRFDISTSGKVEQASLSPASAQQGQLGSCLLGIAKAIRFHEQPEPTSFRIPIRMQVN